MVKRYLLLFVILLSLSEPSYALWKRAFPWEKSFEIGYGKSHDPNYSKYYNSGFLFSADLYPLYHHPYAYLSLGGALGKWYTTAPINKNITTAAGTLNLRVYPWTNTREYPVYLMGSAGPALLSCRDFGYNDQGSNISGQWYFGAGIEYKHFDINLRYMHFSNAHTTSPDEGFNIQYLLSIGYLIST